MVDAWILVDGTWIGDFVEVIVEIFLVVLLMSIDKVLVFFSGCEAILDRIVPGWFFGSSFS